MTKTLVVIFAVLVTVLIACIPDIVSSIWLKRKIKRLKARKAAREASAARRGSLRQRMTRAAEAAAESAPALEAAARRERRPNAPRRVSKAAPAPPLGHSVGLYGGLVSAAYGSQGALAPSLGALHGSGIGDATARVRESLAELKRVAEERAVKDRIVEDEDDPDYVDFMRDLRLHKSMGIAFEAVELYGIMHVTLSDIAYEVPRDVYWRAIGT